MKTFLLMSLLITQISCASKPSRDFCNEAQMTLQKNDYEALANLYNNTFGHINAKEEEKTEAFLDNLEKCDLIRR